MDIWVWNLDILICIDWLSNTNTCTFVPNDQKYQSILSEPNKWRKKMLYLNVNLLYMFVVYLTFNIV
jgi:hypothetical protein